MMKLEHLVILLSTFVVGRAIIIILHEMGHALCAASFSKKRVTVYIGSQGKQENNITFRSGLILWNINNNPLYWKGGLCVPDANSEMKQVQKLIFLLAGPLLPAFLATIFLYASQVLDLHENIIVFAIFLFVGSAFSMVYNLIPRKKPIKLYNGNETSNDGQAIKNLIKHWKMHAEYVIAINHYKGKDYEKSANAFMHLIDNGVVNDTTYRFAISSYLQLKKYNEAKPLIEYCVLKFKLNSDDYCNAGLMYSNLDLHDKAFELYEESLLLNPSNTYTLNNMGYTLNVAEKYSEAISYFDKAIGINPDFPYAYNNRGLSKIKTGAISEGLRDLERSHTIDPTNSYYFKNLGIYHFDRQEYNEALQLFCKAKEIDNDTYKIDYHIAETQILIRQ